VRLALAQLCNHKQSFKTGPINHKQKEELLACELTSTAMIHSARTKSSASWSPRFKRRSIAPAEISGTNTCSKTEEKKRATT
jgi:hypothetical protein